MCCGIAAERWGSSIYYVVGISHGNGGVVDTVEEIVQIAKANPDKKIAIHGPLDERREETEALINLGVERMFP